MLDYILQKIQTFVSLKLVLDRPYSQEANTMRHKTGAHVERSGLSQVDNDDDRMVVGLGILFKIIFLIIS